MKFKFAAVALLASVTLFCSEGFGTDLLGRVLGRGCCGCEVSSCEPDCGCDAAPVVEDCGCAEAVGDCGCDSGCGLLSRLGNRNRRGILCGCGPTCPEEVAAPCCEAAPVVADCGCEAEPACADPCASRVGLLAKLRARCGSRDCGCEVIEEAPCCEPEPVVEDCGCEAEPVCADPCASRVGLLAKLRARCGSRCGSDCGCEVVEEAPCCEPEPVVEDCGCEAEPVCADPCASRVGLLAKLRARCASRDCGCEVVEEAPCCEPAPAPAPVCEPAPVDCGCEAEPACADPCASRVGLLAKLRARCGSRCGSDCGCEVVEEAPCCEPAPAPAPVCEPAPVDCGCEAEPACADPCESRVGLLARLRGRLGSCGCKADACGCEVVEAAPCCEAAPEPACEPASAACGCEAEPACGCEAAPACGGRLRGRLGCGSKRGCGAATGCGCDTGCDSGCNDGCARLTLLDRLRGNRLPRGRDGRVLCGCPNDGCNPPCPGGCDTYAPVDSGCSSCGGGEVISYGAPAGVVAPAVESVPAAEGVVVPDVNEAQGQVLPGDGASKKPVVRPNAFVIRAAR